MNKTENKICLTPARYVACYTAYLICSIFVNLLQFFFGYTMAMCVARAEPRETLRTRAAVVVAVVVVVVVIVGGVASAAEPRAEPNRSGSGSGWRWVGRGR